MSAAADHHSTTMLLRKLESIAPLSDEERGVIQGLPARTRTLLSGQDIVRDGDQPSQCCLILDGWLCRYKLLGEGRRQIYSFHVAGDIPDLQSLHVPVMDHSLGTLTKATVAFIPHESVRELMLHHQRLGAILWRETLIDAAIFRRWMLGMGRKTAYGRTAHLFCELYLKQEAVGLAGEYRCFFPVTQSELADAMGMSNVHVNRVLQEMRSNGLITLRGSTLTIHDWDALRRSAEFDPAYLHLEKPAA